MASLPYPPNRLDNQSGVGMAWMPYNSYRLTLIYIINTYLGIHLIFPK